MGARPRTHHHRVAARAAAAAIAIVVLAGTDPAAAAGPVYPPTLGPFTYVSTGNTSTGFGGQGYASNAFTGGWVWTGLTATKIYNKWGYLVTRLYPPSPYTHIGDPDAQNYYVYVPLQRDDGVRTLAFQGFNLWNGTTFVAEWTVPSSYMTNNSWVAVSPDNRWILNGGWGNMTRFTAFARPTTGGTIQLAFRINLDRTLRNIQGCDFVTNARLICQDDVEGSLNKSVWQVDLTTPMNGADVSATTTRLGAAPGDQNDPACVEGESEGVDYGYTSKKLRTVFINGCSKNLTGTVYSDYQQP